ncbi:hypothetical protein EJB05_55917, partial [Eragrostis curvula]
MRISIAAPSDVNELKGFAARPCMMLESWTIRPDFNKLQRTSFAQLGSNFTIETPHVAVAEPRRHVLPLGPVLLPISSTHEACLRDELAAQQADLQLGIMKKDTRSCFAKASKLT